MKKILSLCIAIVLCVSLCACGSASKYTENKLALQNGAISIDGDAFFPKQDGTVEKISGEIYSAVATKDRNHTVILEKDGSLSILSGGTKTLIANDVRGISEVTDDAIIFSRLENEGKYYPPNDYSFEKSSNNIYSYGRYTFLNAETYSLGESVTYRMSDIGGTLLYSINNEKNNKYELHLVKANEVASNIVLTSTNPIQAVGVNQDGSVYAWAEKSSDGYTVFIYANGEKQKAFVDEKADAYSYYMSFNAAGNFATITASGFDTIALWTLGNGVTKVRLPGNLYNSTFYTDTGHIGTYPEVEAGAVYVLTDEGKNVKNLYAITLDGTREKIANSITDMAIRLGHLYYITNDGVLYASDLSNGVLTNETKIADGVCDFVTSPDGAAIIYSRDVASDCMGALYYYTAKLDRPVRISAESYCYAYYYSYSGYWSYNLPARFSNDGTTILYFADSSKIEDTYYYSGTLMQYKIANEETIRIGSDILTSIDGAYVGSYPKYDDFWYYKYATLDDEGRAIFDLMYWNGEAASTLANDIVK